MNNYIKQELDNTIKSLNRLAGQIKALIEMIENLNLDDPKQVRKVLTLYKAVVSAASSSREKFNEVYIKHKVLKTLEEIDKVF